MKYIIILSLVLLIFFLNLKDIPSNTENDYFVEDGGGSKENLVIIDSVHDEKKFIISEYKHDDANDSLNAVDNHELYANVVSQVESGDYSKILLYHSVIAFCGGIPRDLDERAEWISSNSTSTHSDISLLDYDMEICSNIPRLSFDERSQLYRTAIDLGFEQAELALAQLIPSNSAEKVRLLRNSSSWSNDAIVLIAEIALFNQGDLTKLERVFWITISDIGNTYDNNQYDSILNDLIYTLDHQDLESLSDMLQDWKSGDENKMKAVIDLFEKT